jgi:cytochrome c biogenesis protein CcmG/thiol:disulfide interchange protein DsbE
MSSSASTDPGTSPKRRRLLSLGIGVVLAAGLWVALTSFTAPGATKAPTFSLPRLGGGPRVSVPIVGEGAHDPVILTFFASWCAQCHSELPSVAEVARQAEAAGDKVRFIGIDDNEKVAPGLAFVRASGVQFPVGRDYDSLTASRYGIIGNPATVFIDADGKVARKILGPVSTTTLETEIVRLDRT